VIKVNLDWEDIDDFHQRAKVPGGWLVKVHQDVYVSLHEDMRPTDGYAWQTSMTFVPDLTHSWGEEEIMQPGDKDPTCSYGPPYCGGCYNHKSICNCNKESNK